jgi:hypothetical protein
MDLEAEYKINFKKTKKPTVEKNKDVETDLMEEEDGEEIQIGLPVNY